jgi:hypothetical protein
MAVSAASVLNDVNAVEIGYLLGFIQQTPKDRTYGSFLTARLPNLFLITQGAINVYYFSYHGNLTVTNQTVQNQGYICNCGLPPNPAVLYKSARQETSEQLQIKDEIKELH